MPGEGGALAKDVKDDFVEGCKRPLRPERLVHRVDRPPAELPLQELGRRPLDEIILGEGAAHGVRSLPVGVLRSLSNSRGTLEMKIR